MEMSLSALIRHNLPLILSARSPLILSRLTQRKRQVDEVGKHFVYTFFDFLVLGFAVRGEPAVLPAYGNPFGTIDSMQVSYNRLQMSQRTDAYRAAGGAYRKHRFGIELVKAEKVERIFQNARYASMIVRRTKDDGVRPADRLNQRMNVRIGRHPVARIEKGQRFLIQVEQRNVYFLLL